MISKGQSSCHVGSRLEHSRTVKCIAPSVLLALRIQVAAAEARTPLATLADGGDLRLALSLWHGPGCQCWFCWVGRVGSTDTMVTDIVPPLGNAHSGLGISSHSLTGTSEHRDPQGLHLNVYVGEVFMHGLPHL